MRKYSKALATIPGGLFGLAAGEYVVKMLCDSFGQCLVDYQAMGVEALVVVLVSVAFVYWAPKNTA